MNGWEKTIPMKKKNTFTFPTKQSTQVRVQVWQDYGGNRNFQGGTFMGYRLLG
mgnify:CR=1 FL=1